MDPDRASGWVKTPSPFRPSSARSRQTLKRRSSLEKAVPFFASVVYYIAIAVVVIAVLELFGVETTSLVTVLGAAGLAIGLAMQGTLSNVASGVMILVFRPFRLGDFVEASGLGQTPGLELSPDR